MGVLALHNIAIYNPKLTSRVLHGNMAKSGYSYAGAGIESTVFRNGSEVIKVNRQSMRLEESARQDLAAKITEENAAMVKYLGSFALPQELFIDKHPVKTSKRAVQARQPFCNFTELDIFVPLRPEVNFANVERAYQTFPGIEDELRDLAKVSRSLYQDTQLLPDIGGMANVVVALDDTPKLTILDGQPLTRRDSVTQDIALAQFAAMETALDQLAC